MKKLLKIAAVVVAAVVVLMSFTSCSSGKSLDDIKKAGKLVIATSPDFPPFEYLDGEKVVGIEVEIMELVAKDLGVELVIEQMDFESVLPGVQSGKFDVAVSGITITEDRKENADFTDPYFMASQAIVVMADSEIKGKADLTGKKIAVQTGTTAEEYCMGEGYEVSSFVANNDAASALTSGKVDAWVVDNAVAIALSAQQNGKTKVLDEAMTKEPYGFGFAKGSDTLVEAVNETLNKYMDDGTIEKIFEKYEEPWVSPKN